MHESASVTSQVCSNLLQPFDLGSSFPSTQGLEQGPVKPIASPLKKLEEKWTPAPKEPNLGLDECTRIYAIYCII